MAESADILRVADEHGRLLQAITELESAPAELRETTGLIESVEKDLAVREKRLQELVKKRKSEAKDVDKLQRSGTKRFLFKLRHGGKEGLERKLEKEEREYVEAAQAEYNENQAIAELKETLEVSKAKKSELLVGVDNRKRMLQQINDLYTSAFSGPTPDFPEEDSAEDELKAAESHNEEVQARLAHERQVFTILDRAAACANQALASLQSANRNATYDTFGFGGIWAEMAEQDDLVRAQSLATQAERHMKRAREVQPLVEVVQGAELVQPEWLNVVFDNLYTDFVFQQKIRQSLASMTRFQQGIFGQCKASEDRIKQLEANASDAKEFLTSRRRQLMNVRREILARIREEGPSAGGLRVAPPAYNPDRSPSPVGSMPGAFPEHPSVGGTSSVPAYAETAHHSLPEFSPPSYSSDEARLQAPSNDAEAEPTVYPPSRSPSPSVHPQYAPPAGPPPHHLHHESGAEVNAKSPEGLNEISRSSSRAGSPAPSFLRSSSNSNSARASVHAPPPGPPLHHGGAPGGSHMTHDGLVRTSSTSSSSYVTSLSRPGTPGSPFGSNALLHPHSPSRTPPRSRSPSPSLLTHTHSSRPSSPLSPASSRPHSPAIFNSNELPPTAGSLPSTPSMPAPSIPNFSSNTGPGTSALGNGPFSPLGVSGSGIGHALLWGAPTITNLQQNEAGRSALSSPPSMPVPELFSQSVTPPDVPSKDIPPVPPKDAPSRSTSDAGQISAETPIEHDALRSATTDDTARSRFASNNPFRNFVS